MPMTPVVNQAEFRQAIAAVPAHVKQPLRDAFVTAGYPSLDPAVHVWDVDTLHAAAVHLADVAKANGAELRIPLDTTALKARTDALPDDLAELAAREAQEQFTMPAMAHHSRWGLDHWEQADQIIAHAEELAAARLRHVHGALALVKDQAGDDPDAYRHTVVGCVTNGRTESARKLTGPEAAHLARWAEAVSLGQGGPPIAYEPDWKAEAKRLGLTQADLKKLSGEWHRARHLEVPAKLSDVTDHRAIAYLIGTANDGRTVMSDAADVMTPEVAVVVAAEAILDNAALDDGAAIADTHAEEIADAATGHGERNATELELEVPAGNTMTDTTPQPAPDGTVTAATVANVARALAAHKAAKAAYEQAAADLLNALEALGAPDINVSRP